MKKAKKWLLRLCFWLSLLGLMIVGIGYIQYRQLIANRPLVEVIEIAQKNSNYVTLDLIDPFFLQAIVTTEDRRFYDRQGFDIWAFGRAIITNMRQRALVEGGSTIGQQVAKNLYFDHRTSVMRKIMEVFLLYDIEKAITKDETLELYVNIIYYGDGYTGIRRASRGYFGKEPIALSAGQATLLAGLPNSPSRFQLSNHFNRAKTRQRHILDALVRYQVISKEKADEIYQEDVYE